MKKNVPRNIIVFGASGNSGIKICEALSAKQIHHTAFVRKGSEQKLQSKASQLAFGDVRDKTTLEAALGSKSFTDVIIALGSKDLKPTEIRSEGTKNIVDTLKKLGQSSKLHVVSAHGVGDSWNQLNWIEKLITKLFLNKTMKDHELQERIAKSYEGGYHIIRPVALKNSEPTGKIHSSDEGKLPHGDISRADLATYITDSILARKNGTVSVCRK